MSRLLTSLILGLLVISTSLVAHAQEAEAAGVASLAGLERIVARSYTAPATTMTSTESSPDERPSGTFFLSVLIHEFDSSDTAAASFETLDADLQHSIKRDLRAPMTGDLMLDGMGDQARGYIGDLMIEGTTLASTFATVQDEAYVYSLTGQFLNLDGEEQTQNLLQSLIDADAGTGEGDYREDGTSTGGLWDKFSLLSPDLAEGSTITDLQLAPQPASSSASGSASAIEVLTDDVHNLSALDGIRNAWGVTYRQEDSATSQDGVFRIESWILSFDSQEEASQAVDPLSNTLTEPIDVNARSNNNVNVNGLTVTTSVSAGRLSDASLPGGNGVVNVQQRENMVYVTVVYAIDEDPAPIAEGIIDQMISTPEGAEPADIHAENGPMGGIWDRFPKAGNPLLENLVPVEVMHPDVA